MITEKIKTNHIKQINNNLLLNTSFLTNLGLFNGKMGICIYFFLLSKKTGNIIFKDFAEELIDEIYGEITIETPLDFKDGLAGIGWGIEYLAQNDFVEADTDEILEEFDKKLISKLATIINNELCESFDLLIGLGFYFLKRIQNPRSNNHIEISINNTDALKRIIDGLYQIVRNKEKFNSIIEEPKTLNSKIHHTNFDIDWSYSTLIFLLSNIRAQDIFKTETEEILSASLEQFEIEDHIPKFHSIRLLFKLALLEYNKTCNISNKLITGLLTNQLEDINRMNIEKELMSKPQSIKYGIPGILWIYYRLYLLNSNHLLKKEIDWWYNKYFEIVATTQDFVDSYVNGMDENLGLGIIEGIAGHGLINLEIKK
jgi:hypothetical protein